jgi:hypothetical protein
MASKAKRLKQKKKHKKNFARIEQQTPTIAPVGTGRKAERPTDERTARGVWAVSRDAVKHQQPMVDLSCDCIGALYVGGALNHTQEQAARSFQGARWEYLRELPGLSAFKSCLAGSVPSYDDGDGDVEIIRHYRAIETKLRRRGLLRVVLVVCDGDQMPSDLNELRDALDLLTS